MHYRIKPVDVEAFQMTKEHRWDNSEWPDWLHDAWNSKEWVGSLFVSFGDSDDTRLSLGIKGGRRIIEWGDWIIKDIVGELSLCDADTFAAMYDKIGG